MTNTSTVRRKSNVIINNIDCKKRFIPFFSSVGIATILGKLENKSPGRVIGIPFEADSHVVYNSTIFSYIRHYVLLIIAVCFHPPRHGKLIKVTCPRRIQHCIARITRYCGELQVIIRIFWKEIRQRLNTINTI